MAPRDMVLVGHISGAHGIKGEVKLKSFTADPEAIATYGPLHTAAGGRIEILRLRAQKDGFIAALKGVGDRNAAEALKSSELFVARDALPDLGEGEVYLADLVGLPVLMKDGTRLGEVIGIENYGAGDLIDVKVEGRRTSLLIPFADGYLLAVEGDAMVVDLPEGYLDEDGKA